VTGVAAPTAEVVTANGALVEPAGTVTLAGTAAIPAAAPLESETTAPPEGAAAVSVAVPCDELPPPTRAGLNVIEDKLDPPGEIDGWNRRDADQGPATPAEFTPRTRQKRRTAGSPPIEACELVTDRETTAGAANALESSISIV
jgi:hypothetical protein